MKCQKTLTIRRWLILSLIAICVVPVLFFNVAALALGGSHWWGNTDQARQTQALDRAATLITADASRWSDPAWQRSTGEQLAALGVSAEIDNPQGGVLFRADSGAASGPPWAQSWHTSSREIQVMDGSRPLGTVDLSVFGTSSHVGFAAGAIGALAGLVLTLVGVGWLMGHYVVRPLEATSRAARRIAGGDLDFAVPQSRVREVDEVRSAFEAMGDGLRESIARQAELEEERRFFIGAIAHDLRTPLFSLRGYLLGLERGIAATPEKVAHYVAICRQKSDQLDRLVSDLFAYTKAEYLEQTVRPEPLDLGMLLAGAAESFRPRAMAKEVEIALDGDADAAFVEGDAHLLERTVENLLDNALRHTPAGGRITVGWHREAERVVFSVADTGPGIAARDLPHLFDPLYRSESSRNPGTGGVGLGLTIARRIMRAHGGDLVTANRPEGGAVFTGWLARAPQPAAAEREPSTTSAVSS